MYQTEKKRRRLESDALSLHDARTATGMPASQTPIGHTTHVDSSAYRRRLAAMIGRRRGRRRGLSRDDNGRPMAAA